MENFIIVLLLILISIYFLTYINNETFESYSKINDENILTNEIISKYFFDILYHDLHKVTPEIYNPGKNIAIIYLYTSNIYQYAKHSIKNLKNYADKHGYTLIIYDQMISEDVYPCWNKILAILANISKYQYVVWFDADAIVSNPNITFEKFIKENPGKDLLICFDCVIARECINSGIMIMANTPWLNNLLVSTWTCPVQHRHNDQNVLYNQILKQSYPNQTFRLKYPEICHELVHPKVAILPENSFNSHITSYLHGDFVIHLMGLDTVSRINIMRQINTALGLDNYYPSECISALNKYGSADIDYDLKVKQIEQICYTGRKK